MRFIWPRRRLAAPQKGRPGFARATV